MKKEIIKAYKYRIYPNKQQEEMLIKHFGCSRFVYNKFLFDRQEQYKQNGKSDNYYKQAKLLTKLKKDENFKWLREVNSQTLQQSLKHLEVAYINFFKGKSGLPKYKKKTHKNSFTVPQFIKFENSRIYIPKCKNGIKIKEHQLLQGTILFATFSKTPTNKYYVSIAVKQSYDSKQRTNKEIGIDLGIKDLIITSSGQKFQNNKFKEKYAEKLKKAQQHLSRKVKGSRRYENQRLKVALIHEKIANCRSDVLHKITHELVKKYDVVYLENLNIKGMLQNHNLARNISDCAWYELVRQLKYKGDWDDTVIFQINRFYPSSQICHKCGYQNKEVKNLSIREWVCPNCNTHLDRDINASINILLEGKREISAGTVDYTNGEGIKPIHSINR